MTKNKLNTLLAATLFTALPFQSLAAEAEVKVDLDKKNKSLSSEVDHKRDTDKAYHREGRAENGIKPSNKATALLGMEVRNGQNEKLGEIKDLVLDMNSGKVSYAVLAVGGFLGLGEKLLAIPPSAFRFDEAERILILNADRAKVEQAPGFAATNWPEIGNTSWGAEAARWNDTGTTTSEKPRASSELRRERDNTINVDSQSSRARQAELKTSVDTDRKSVDVSSNVRATGPGTLATDQYIGKVRSVNVEDRLVRVETQDGSKEFYVPQSSKISIYRNSNPSLVDLKPGHPVEVSYHMESGKMVVDSIERTTR